MGESRSVDRASFDSQVAATFNDQWKWRHQHCWKLLNRYGLTGLTIAIVPYLHRLDFFNQKLSELVGKLGNWELFFPLAGWAIAQSAVYLFAEEYVRCRPVETMCNRVLARQHSSPLPVPEVYAPVSTHRQSVQRVLRSIGQTTILIYSSFATLFTLANTYMIITMYGLDIRPRSFWIAGGLLSLVSIIGAFFLSQRAGQKIVDILTYQEKEEERYLESVKQEVDTFEKHIQSAVSQPVSSTPVAAPSSNLALVTEDITPKTQDIATQQTEDGHK